MSTPPPTLLTLPAELRLQIFESFLSNSTSTSTTPFNIRHRNGVHFLPTTTRTVLAILQINRQIRHEISQPFFQTLNFTFCDGFTSFELRDWMATFGEEAVRDMKKVVLLCRGKCTMFGLQPDTDYCHRSAHLDLTNKTSPPIHYDPCSNSAYGCKEQTLESLHEFGIRDGRHDDQNEKLTTITPELLMKLFLALTKDNSSSAA